VIVLQKCSPNSDREKNLQIGQQMKF